MIDMAVIIMQVSAHKMIYSSTGKIIPMKLHY